MTQTMTMEASPDRKSSRHSHKSRSPSGERRRRHRSHDNSERDYKDVRARSSDRDRARDGESRDKDRERRRRHDGEREHRHRDRDRSGQRERSRRDKDRTGEDREHRERRRKRDEDYPADEKHKRPKPDVDEENGSERTSRRARSRDSDRRSVRSGRGGRDPRDEFDGPMRSSRRDRDRNDNSRRSPQQEDRRRAKSPPPPPRPSSPLLDAPIDPYTEDPTEDDSEARSVFVSQLAARMTARDLGYFFEEKLGDNTVMDSRIVTDRLSRRSKGIAYVEFRTVELVDKAISLSGTIVMGLPIMVQHTEAERNKTHAGDGSINLPPGASGRGATLYVGSLHFSLTESDIQQVFEPFGELDFVDLHKDPATGRSKGYAFIHYKHADNAKMALEQMDGFELAGRQLKVNTVHEKGGQVRMGNYESLDDGGGGNLNAASRQALMQKLARMDSAPIATQPEARPVIAQNLTTKCVLLRNMFNPDEEEEPHWDRTLAEDVKDECQAKYGRVQYIKVERDSEGEIYMQYDSVDSAKKAIEGLNKRWFGGRQISAAFISDAVMAAHR